MAQGPLEVEGPPDGDRRTLRGKTGPMTMGADRDHEGADRHVERVFNPEPKDTFGGNGNSAQDEAAGWSSGLKKELRCLTSDKRRRRGRQGCRR